MSDAVITAAREDMLDAMLKIERESFSAPWPRTGFVSEMESEDSLVLAAETDGALAGFAVLHMFGDEAELYNIAVAHEFRRRGIGEKLLKSVLEDGRSRGVAAVFLEVRDSNSGARAMYGKFGFEVCGRRRNYYDGPVEDAIIMRLDLAGDMNGDAAE